MGDASVSSTDRTAGAYGQSLSGVQGTAMASPSCPRRRDRLDPDRTCNVRGYATSPMRARAAA